MKLNDASRISGEISFATWNKTQWYIYLPRGEQARAAADNARIHSIQPPDFERHKSPQMHLLSRYFPSTPTSHIFRNANSSSSCCTENFSKILRPLARAHSRRSSQLLSEPRISPPLSRSLSSSLSLAPSTHALTLPSLIMDYILLAERATSGFTFVRMMVRPAPSGYLRNARHANL